MYRCILLLSFLKISQSYLVIPGPSRLLSLNQNGPIPDSVDWRSSNNVSPVKDQGDCNACWAFAIVGTVESHASIHNISSVQANRILSEQFLIDCLPKSQGCAAQSILEAYGVPHQYHQIIKYENTVVWTVNEPGNTSSIEKQSFRLSSDLVAQLGFVVANEDYYPYVGRKMKCRWRQDIGNSISLKTELRIPVGLGQAPKAPFVVHVTGFTRIRSDEDEMAKHIAKYGPITAGINPASMMKYPNKPVIDEPSEADCDPNDLHHSVTIVGYSTYVGSDGRSVKYWIIKNSWGEAWGDQGYYYLVRGRNACGIASDVSMPFVG